LVPFLIADVCLEGCFLDFHFASFLASQGPPIPRIIIIAAFTRNGKKWKTGLRLFWWSMMCFNIQQSAGHHLLVAFSCEKA
jgi:hypothetical protein